MVGVVRSGERSAGASVATRSELRLTREFLSIADFEACAQRRLPACLFAYLKHGAEQNRSTRDNHQVFDELWFLPSVLRDVSGRHQRKTLFGRTYMSPFGMAPMGLTGLLGYRGDVVLAEAAEAEGIPMLMSAASLVPMEEVASHAPSAWFQAYLPADPECMEAYVARITCAGFGTLVVTVDTAVRPSLEHYVRAGFSSPLRPNLRLLWDGVTHPRWSVSTFLQTLIRHGMPCFENNDYGGRLPILSRHASIDFSGRARATWQVIQRVRKLWTGTLVLKGILSTNDALQARHLGIDGLIISNHGGRYLDGSPSPLRVLPDIRAAVGDFPLMVDGGFRRGSDVVKAIALGADFVFLGRSFAYALAAAGAPGVTHAIRLLSKEIDTTLGLLGLSSIDEVSQDALCTPRQPVVAKRALGNAA